MYNESLVESLVESIYEAATGASGWSDFLTALATALDSGFPSVYFADTSSRKSDVAVSLGMEEKMLRAYRDYYHERNVWLKGARALLQPGVVRPSHLLCPRRTFLRSEWYGDFCRPMHWTQGLGATILQTGTITSNIGVFADNRRRAYDNEDVALLKALMPHLQRGFRMHMHLVATRAREQALGAVLHAVSTPVMLVTDQGQIVFLNSAAEALVNTSDGLAIELGKLRTQLAREGRLLDLLIGGAAQTSAKRGRNSGGVLKVTRPSGREPLQVLVSPLATREDWILRQPSVAAVFVTDPQRVALPEVSVPMTRGLTPTEAKVAAALARGVSGKQICRELGISYNTLKTHARKVYAKTGTRRQTELVRFISDRRLEALTKSSRDLAQAH